MATIKELLQNFCYRINVPAPTAFVGVSSPAEQQYLSLFQFIGDNLRNRPYQWPQLKRGYTFTTQTNVSQYQLPGDFYRLLDSTQWDTTNQWPMRGPTSDFSLTARRVAVLGLQNQKVYQLRGPVNYTVSSSSGGSKSQGWFEIDPAGSNNTDELFLGYVSCNWVWPRDWEAATGYTAGQLRSGVGYVYRADGNGTSGTTRPSWSTGSQSDGGINWTVYLERYLCNPSNDKLNDSDLCLFDEDLMIEGMRWAYLRAKGQDFQQERSDWEQQVKSSFARFDGPVRINLADELTVFDDWPLTPPGSWNV